MKKKKRNNKSIVFRPGLVKDPDFDRVARVNFFLNQNDVVLVKKKNQQVATGFLTRSPGYIEFFLPLFFLQPDLIPAPDRPARPGWILKL
jgi:hypothetical protein